jgi:endonuclease-3
VRSCASCKVSTRCRHRAELREPYQLLVATILSAQATDAGVNRVTPALFGRYADAAALAGATAEDLEPMIHSTGFFRAKAKSLMGMARALVERHGGQVPNTMEALVELPGVGPTANVVLAMLSTCQGCPSIGTCFASPTASALRSGDPVEVERQLARGLPPQDWVRCRIR